jgi:hypothetical protein
LNLAFSILQDFAGAVVHEKGFDHSGHCFLVPLLVVCRHTHPVEGHAVWDVSYQFLILSADDPHFLLCKGDCRLVQIVNFLQGSKRILDRSQGGDIKGSLEGQAALPDKTGQQRQAPDFIA